MTWMYTVYRNDHDHSVLLLSFLSISNALIISSGRSSAAISLFLAQGVYLLRNLLSPRPQALAKYRMIL
jgi:uncharacterized membrane protein